MDKVQIKRLKDIIEKTDLLKDAVFKFSLKNFSSIKSGGTCTCFLRADRRKDLLCFLKDCVPLCRESGTEIYPVGDSTNILFNDGNLNLILIRLGEEFDYIDIGQNGHIRAGAALRLQKFVVEAAKKGYDYSYLAGIPGTLGGAIAGSSGAPDININSTVKNIKYISLSGNKVEEIKTPVTSSNYSYREFNISGPGLLTDIYFEYQPLQKPGHKAKNIKGKPDNEAVKPGKETGKEAILKRIRDNIALKKSRQPLNTKNAGCIFKNPAKSGLAAGEMIDICGFKGFKYGGAEVSDLHANFIINSGNASSKDIFVLSKIIKNAVMQRFGVELEYEIRLVGF